MGWAHFPLKTSSAKPRLLSTGTDGLQAFQAHPQRRTSLPSSSSLPSHRSPPPTAHLAGEAPLLPAVTALAGGTGPGPRWGQQAFRGGGSEYPTGSGVPAVWDGAPRCLEMRCRKGDRWHRAWRQCPPGASRGARRPHSSSACSPGAMAAGPALGKCRQHCMPTLPLPIE